MKTWHVDILVMFNADCRSLLHEYAHICYRLLSKGHEVSGSLRDSDAWWDCASTVQ